MSRLLYRQFPCRALQRPFRYGPAYGARSYAAGAAPVSQFDWADPLGSKNLLTAEELAVSETAERYCQEQLLPRVLRKAP